jgi:hypothetical protein
MSSRLPETELANWAFLSRNNKRDALERHVQPKKIIGSYEPFREILGDAVNKQLPLFAESDQPSTPWLQIERRIRAHSRCRRDEDTLRMNLEVAKATHDFAEAAKITAVPIDVTSLAFGVGHLYQFGLSLLMRFPDRVAAVFLDMRRSNGLSIDGRGWIFAAMHERYRTAYPDLSAIDLQIWKYRAKGNRSIIPFTAGDIRISYDDLVADVRETYSIYDSVLAGEREKKRGSSGGSGSLL